MKTSRYSDPLILSILRQAEGGVPVAELCREHGMSNASFSKWRAKFGGMDASMITQMKTDPAPCVPSFMSRARSPYAPASGGLQRLLV